MGAPVGNKNAAGPHEGWHTLTRDEMHRRDLESFGMASKTAQRANVLRAEAMKPYREQQEVHVTRHIPGSSLTAGSKGKISQVVNNGTKKKPEYRYNIGGSWVDHDAMSERGED